MRFKSSPPSASGSASASALGFARLLAAAILVGFTVSGCAVVAVADAAVTVVATGVSVTAQAVGAAADLVIPDDDEDD